MRSREPAVQIALGDMVSRMYRAREVMMKQLDCSEIG